MRTIDTITKEEYEESKGMNNIGWGFGYFDKGAEKIFDNLNFVYFTEPWDYNKGIKWIFPKKYNRQILNRYYGGKLENLTYLRDGDNKVYNKIVQIAHVIVKDDKVSIWSCSEDFLG